MTRFRSALYRGELVHARDDSHARRTFRYGVYMAALDLDEIDALDRELRWFSAGGRNLFAFDERDYAATCSPSAAAGRGDLRASIDALLAANDLPPAHDVRLVTNLRTFGYVFNPVSFFLCYDPAGDITAVVAEVNNTYGGSFRYVLGPRDQISASKTAASEDARDQIAGARVGFRHVRELFVSPFLHGPASYEFWFDAPLDDDRLAIAIHVRDASERPVFVARFGGTRSSLSDRGLVAAAIRYPFMTARVIGLIHWQALKLRLLGVPFLRPLVDQRPRQRPRRPNQR